MNTPAATTTYRLMTSDMRTSQPPPVPVPMAITGETAVKVTPWTRGSRAPTFRTPRAWTTEATPQVRRSALTRWTSSWRERTAARR